MRTRADLVNRAAKYLGKLIAGGELPPEDFASINDEIPSIVKNLNARGITYIPDVEEIEDELFLPVARIVAAAVCADFSVPLNTLAGFEGEPVRSEMQLRVLGRATFPDETIRFNNF